MSTDPIAAVYAAEATLDEQRLTTWAAIVARADDGDASFSPAEVFAHGRTAAEFRAAVELRRRRREAAAKVQAGLDARAKLSDLEKENVRNNRQWKTGKVDPTTSEAADSEHEHRCADLNRRTATQLQIVADAEAARDFLFSTDLAGVAERRRLLVIRRDQTRHRLADWPDGYEQAVRDSLAAELNQIESQVSAMEAELLNP
ncbi:MAG: hypothetical protein AB7O59_01010 [Pirellulales bacterium]